MNRVHPYTDGMPEQSRARSHGFSRLTWIDVVPGIVLVVLALASVASPDSSLAYDFDLSQPLVYGLAALGSAPYVFVRHFPTTAYACASLVLLALNLLGGYFGLLPTFLGFAIGWVAFAATPPRAIFALILTLLGFSVLGVMQAAMWDTPLALTNVIGFTAVWALGYALARWLERQQRRVAEVERREALAREQERSRLARELHDSVSNSLAALTVQLKLLEEEAPDPGVRKTAALLGAESRGALTELRRLLVVLRNEPDESSRPIENGEDPVEAAIAAHRAMGSTVEISADPRTTIVSDGVRYMLGRAVNELLTNAGRHAPGAPVTLRLDSVDSTLRLSATNPVLETTPAPRDDSYGLIGLRERADEFGGTVDARFQDGAFTVVVEIPGAFA